MERIKKVSPRLNSRMGANSGAQFALDLAGYADAAEGIRQGVEG
jgi:hypothetical protein